MSKEEYIQPRLFEDEEVGVVGIKPERIRSVIKYYGGKGNMVAKILPLLPDGQVYVEPYFGAGFIFFAKQPSPVEVINDIDGEVVNVFRVLQDKGKFEELRHRLMYTLYARGELERAIKVIGFKLGKTKNLIKKEDALVIYYTDKDGLTWYSLNEERLANLFKGGIL
ncbi:MAG: DNA adenine methylase [Candidatus Marinimicrobia bacterium]|nr:DNA adenine methylase [Candidatus Neomarinimicrobiota bacterium]